MQYLEKNKFQKIHPTQKTARSKTPRAVILRSVVIEIKLFVLIFRKNRKYYVVASATSLALILLKSGAVLCGSDDYTVAGAVALVLVLEIGTNGRRLAVISMVLGIVSYILNRLVHIGVTSIAAACVSGVSVSTANRKHGCYFNGVIVGQSINEIAILDLSAILTNVRSVTLSFTVRVKFSAVVPIMVLGNNLLLYVIAGGAICKN